MNAVKVNGETVSTYTYNENRNLIERTDAEGNVYTFDYNADGQLVGQSDPEGAAFHYVYDENGRLEKTIDGNGNVIMREYGVTETSSSGSCTSCGSTPLLGGAGVGERLQKIIYPTFIKEFRYDDEGRVSEEMYTFNGGETSSVSFDYDVFGRLQSTTGPDNRSTTYVYDLMGRRIRVEDPSGATTFEYDTWDNLIALTDAKNQRTAFEYDTLSRLKKEIRPMSQETTYEYNEKGQLWKMVDAKNQMTEYGYDGQGRLETISYADGKTVILNYDPDGNLAGYSDGETSAEYEDDDLGRKIWEKVNYGDFTKEFSYTYYKNGLKKTLTMPDGTMYEYAYGNNNELREVQIPGLGAVTIPDYTWNRPAKMTFPGGTQRTYGYDALMRLQALTVTDPGGNPLLDYQYTYHEVGHIMTKATEHGNYSYDYDASSRLTGVDNPVLDDESYTSDAVGNRLTSADVSGSWSYNANNELLGFADVEYTYDANGNMTQITVAGAVVWTYVYDAANRLKHVEDGTGVISADYYYDPFGRRLWKDVGGTRTYFFYSEEGLIGEYDASGNAIKTYGYKPDSTWTTDPLFMKQGTDYYFYQNDHLGTPQKLVAMNGAVVWSAQYNAFGEAEVQVETVTNNLRFPGQYFDVETGLHYNFQRYYDPRIGRYIQDDPVGFEGGINTFVYVLNNPGKNSDPLGLWVHAQHIVTPQEAYNVVAQTAAIASINPDSPDLDIVAETGAEELLKILMKHLKKSNRLQEFYGLSGEKKYSEAERLLKLLGHYVSVPGVRDPAGWHNRFVFTCQYGWIDMGHFFIAAADWGYSSAFKAFTAKKIFYPSEMAETGELLQWIKADKVRGNPDYESSFTPEDFLSNELGIQFGSLVKALEPIQADTIATMWNDFLIESGAVSYKKEGETRWVYNLLRKDVLEWWEKYDDQYLVEGNVKEDPKAQFDKTYAIHWDLVKCKSQAYRELCCCATSEAECDNNLTTGACWAKPRNLTLWYMGQ